MASKITEAIRMRTERKEHTMKSVWNDKRGFTLIELVVVIAILGILAAIAIPVVSSYLGSSKTRAYDADAAKIQTAIDAYYSHPSNDKAFGRRQYPNDAQTNKGTSAAVLRSAAEDDMTNELGIANSNPVGGTEGGTPYWVDTDADGVRDDSSEILLRDPPTSSTIDHWLTTDVTRGSKTYVVDSRDWFVNFAELVTDDLMSALPTSASSDNDSSNGTGSYSWYIDSDGRVKSLFYFFPESDQTGYQNSYP